MMEKLLTAWTSFVIRHAVLVLLGLAALTAAAGWYAVTAFEMNSNASELVRQDTGWRKTYDAYLDAFPQYNQNTFAVISGRKPNEVREVTLALRDELLEDPIFSSVYAPGVSEFSDRNSLLYVDLDRLDQIVVRLADAQPFLAAIASDPTLRGPLNLLRDAFNSSEDLPPAMDQMADSLSLAAEQAMIGNTRPISWRDEIFQVGDTDTFYQIIVVQGSRDFDAQLPNRDMIAGINRAIGSFIHPYKEDVSIRLSGQVALDHEEIESAVGGAQITGALALLVLAIVLLLGVRSLSIIAATYLSMLIGLVWTSAFAMLVVGQYNTISIIFLVIFIGLGVDFAIHLCLRYQEATQSQGKTPALIDTAKSLGAAIILCGITAAVGFLSFTPTEYKGVAELGIISGGGMIIGVLVTLTLIPAYFAVTRKPAKSAPLPFSLSFAKALNRSPKQMSAATLMLGVILTIIGTQAHFDYSTLAIKNPESEAMTTLNELIAEDIITDYTLTWVAPDEQTALAAQQALRELPVVAEVLAPRDYLPSDQEEKFYLLDDANIILASLFDEGTASTNASLPDAELIRLMVSLAEDMDARLGREDTPSAALTRLSQRLRELAVAPLAARALMHELVMPPIRAEVEWLKEALQAEPLTFDDLPDELKARLVTADGRVLVSIAPAGSLLSVKSLRHFTDEVLAITPTATGRPVLDLGIGEIVLRSFAIALTLAVSVIFIILLLTLRSLVDAFLVFIPLFMTTMVTLTFSVLAGLPLNMANIVVIPLIFGLGVGNGIHVVRRFRQANDTDKFIMSSTPKAVFLSNLTTLVTFCTLSFSPHQGIASIGILLTVAIGSLLILTIVSLPALLETFSVRTPEDRADEGLGAHIDNAVKAK